MSQSRPMFWRIVRRLIAANRGRLIVVLLALGAGAAVTAALLNLQVDAKQRLTNEFRAFGANVVVAPRDASSSLSSTIPETMDNRIPSTNDGSEVTKIDSLYLLVHASHVPRPPQPKNPYPQLAPTNATSDLQNAGVNNLHYEGAESATQSSSSIPVVVVGYAGRNAQHIWPSQIQEGAGRHEDCRVGKNAAKTLDVHAGDYLSLHNGTTKHICLVSTVEDFGSAEDNQIFMNLFSAQQLAFVGHDEKLTNGPQISLIQLSVPGTPQSVEKYIAELQKQILRADQWLAERYRLGCAHAHDALRDGRDDQCRDGAQERRRPDEGDRRSDAPRVALVPRRGRDTRFDRRAHRRGGWTRTLRRAR